MPRTPRPTELGARAAYDRAWQRRMYDSGWAGIAWPRAHRPRGAAPPRHHLGHLPDGRAGDRYPPHHHPDGRERLLRGLLRPQRPSIDPTRRLGDVRFAGIAAAPLDADAAALRALAT